VAYFLGHPVHITLQHHPSTRSGVNRWPFCSSDPFVCLTSPMYWWLRPMSQWKVFFAKVTANVRIPCGYGRIRIRRVCTDAIGQAAPSCVSWELVRLRLDRSSSRRHGKCLADSRSAPMDHSTARRAPSHTRRPPSVYTNDSQCTKKFSLSLFILSNLNFKPSCFLLLDFPFHQRLCSCLAALGRFIIFVLLLSLLLLEPPHQ